MRSRVIVLLILAILVATPAQAAQQLDIKVKWFGLHTESPQP